jgi:hypothetical protein
MTPLLILLHTKLLAVLGESRVVISVSFYIFHSSKRSATLNDSP